MRTLIGLFAVVVVGLFAGSMLFIAAAVQPYWASLPVAQMQAVFKGQAPYIGNFMLAFLNVAIVATLVSAFLPPDPSKRKWIVVAFVCLISILPLYKFVHAPLNHKILSPSPLHPDEALKLLSDWQIGHFVRLAAGSFAFVLMLLGVRK